ILEPIIYWDASYAIAYSVDTEPYHDKCVDFRNRLEAGGILSIAGDFVYDELAFFLVRKSLEAEGRISGQYWRNVMRTQPNFVSTIMPDVLMKTNELDEMTLWLPSNENVKEEAFQLMQSYSILPTDAFHIAVALSHGVTAFATLDADFLKVDDITVYTCLP
ncbi:MAG: type II toxin-antitoxin system VapC family toxin, partial [Candidatus Poribacteria bacterium]